MTTILLTIFMFLLVAIGAAVGSFLNVVIWRVPEKMSLLTPPSHCPKCNSPVRWFDNIPIVSWFVLRGKCRDCKEPISIRYPLVESLSAAATLIVAWALLLGNWTGAPRQLFFWEDYSNWTCAWQEAVAVDSENADNETIKAKQSSSPLWQDNAAASDEFLRLLRSTSLLIICWTLVADLALMLGFVEWDRGGCPASLRWTAVCTILLIAALTLAINDPEKTFGRGLAFVYSVFGGCLGSLVPLCFASKEERLDFLTLGAVWGMGAGYWLAFPVALILGVVALIVKRKTKRLTFGLLIFTALVILLLGQTTGIIRL